MSLYHSLTCETVCPGWGCQCWCHECPDEGGKEPETTAAQRDSGVTNGKVGDSKTAPAGNRGLTTSPAKES